MTAVSARTSTPVRWRPFLLGAVFKATGNEMPARIPAKARWMLGDMQRWSAHYGIPFTMPSRFPMITLRTQRFLAGIEAADASKVAPAALSLFDAFWAQDQDPTSDAALAAAARAAGIDPDPAIAAIETQATKDHLRATTDEAIRRGAFGAPAMFVGDALFWGNDRIPLLEKHLAG
jgi:2-hydroxychromene-2-carboxylate isomerase